MCSIQDDDDGEDDDEDDPAKSRLEKTEMVCLLKFTLLLSMSMQAVAVVVSISPSFSCTYIRTYVRICITGKHKSGKSHRFISEDRARYFLQITLVHGPLSS